MTTILIILAIILAIFVGLYFFGKKAMARQEVSRKQMDAMAQTVSMLIIDKKKCKLKDAGLPSIVYENTPAYMRRSKVPVVTAKVGAKVMTLMCDGKIYDSIPVKKEVKAVVSGIYITSVKGLHGAAEQAPAKKKRFFGK